MTPSVGSVYKGQINEIIDVRAFILFRKPADIRITALAPVVRTTDVDMVSNGTDFRLFLGPKISLSKARTPRLPLKEQDRESAARRFPVIDADHAAQQLEEVPVMTDMTDEDNALYAILFIRKLADGELRAARRSGTTGWT